MTTSGTSAFDLSVVELAEEAWERAGSELRSGYDMRTTRRSINIMMSEWASRGINLWTLDSGSIPLVQGTATYNLPLDTVDLLEHVIRTNAGVVATQADLTITRISVSTYATIPNKLVQGRPIQLYINRLSGQTYPTGVIPPTEIKYPTVTVWPIPDGSTTYTLVYWRLRRLQDAGTQGTNTLDLPFRFMPVFVAGLAFYVAQKIPEGQERLGFLEQQYNSAWELAAGEDREKAAVRFVPRIGYV